MMNNTNSDKNLVFESQLYIPRTAKNKAFEFIPADFAWELDINWVENLSFIHNSSISITQKEDLLNLLAFRAQHIGSSAFKKLKSILISILEKEDEDFTATSFDDNFYLQGLNSYKVELKRSFKAYIDSGYVFNSQAFNVFYLNHCKNLKAQSYNRKHLDPEKGAHTPGEFDSIFEGVRTLIKKMQDKLNEPRPFADKGQQGNVGLLMGGILWVLMLSILRRPVQLTYIKMGDFRTNSGEFEDNFHNSDMLMDYDQLKLQTYRAKNGLPPRSDLDTDLHLLNRKNSQLIILYSTKLFQEQLYRLEEKGIVLTKSEQKQLFKRYPLIPSYRDLLNSENFNNKDELFRYLSQETVAGHVTSKSILTTATKVADNIFRPIYFSERVPNPKRVTGNNRIRHTVLTSMAREGVDAHTLAAITGVSVGTVRHYVDMSPEERVCIDEILGQNATLSNFGKVRLQDQIYDEDDLAFNEYGDVFGSHEEASRCSGCREVLPVPLACYGCDNFTALVDADHASEREKAIKKYQFNINNGQSEKALRRLSKAIEYIEITIAKCEKHKNKKSILGS